MIAELMSTIGPVGTATRCPGCGSGHTLWVATAGADSLHNLLCKTCGTCWQGASGRTVPVDVRACPGCSMRAVCEAATA